MCRRKRKIFSLWIELARGKTHLCGAIANYVLQAGLDVVYLKLYMLDLIRECKYNFENENYQRNNCRTFISQLINIDDLGTSFYRFREQLFYLFDRD